ncbi:MAG: hypothetical protein Q9227_006404 [Pyrenula ochraceoflavens]
MLVQDKEQYVAIAEEFPNTAVGKAKSGGNLFDRRVVRVVTPGTLIDEKFLEPDKSNFLLSVFLDPSLIPGTNLEDIAIDTEAFSKTVIGLAWLDLSTGEFHTQQATIAMLSASLARVSPREIIVEPVLGNFLSANAAKLLGPGGPVFTPYAPSSDLRTISDWNHLLESPLSKEAEEAFSTEQKKACHNLLDYVRNRLQGLDMKLQAPRQRPVDEYMTIDDNALRGLELEKTVRGGLGKGSLLFAIRRTKTNSGARLLRERLKSPSTSIPEISQRLDLVETFILDEALRSQVITYLKDTQDIARLAQKFTLLKGEVDDMLYLSRGVAAAHRISEALSNAIGKADRSNSSSSAAKNQSQHVKSLQSVYSRLDLAELVALAQRIATAIDEEGLVQQQRHEADEAANVAAMAQEAVSAQAMVGEQDLLPKQIPKRAARSTAQRYWEPEGEETWIMRTSASDVLAELHGQLQELRGKKCSLQEDLRVKSRCTTLTLKWSPGLGYHCHLKGGSKRALELLEGRQVQSSKSTQSLYVPEWTELGKDLDEIKLRIRAEEQRIFATLRAEVVKNLVKLRRVAVVLDELDVSTAFAVLAKEKELVRPILNQSTSHNIIGGRHPTVEIGLEEHGRSFVGNDLFLGVQEQVWLVTGPNMAGKSTFLRQNALISIMAQMGSFVPADHAEIGVVDQIFSRIGAADDIAREQSTFMLEMVETAAILKNATERSFVIMDEVGRGTTPEDGTAIGYACLHHLYHVNKCRTLFATHFHALADMTMDLPLLGRYCTDIKENGDGTFHFSRKLKPGVNRQSHALKVAQLAGLPEPVLQTATEVLKKFAAQRVQGAETVLTS